MSITERLLWIALLVLGHLADLITSGIGVLRFGADRWEANPLARLAFDHLGIVGAGLIKMGAVLIIVIWITCTKQRRPIMLSFICGFPLLLAISAVIALY